MTPAARAAAGSYVGCIAGALSRPEYLDGLTGAGFADPSVTINHEAAPGMHAAIIRAVKPDEMTPESHPTQLLTEMAARPGG